MHYWGLRHFFSYQHGMAVKYMLKWTVQGERCTEGNRIVGHYSTYWNRPLVSRAQWSHEFITRLKLVNKEQSRKGLKLSHHAFPPMDSVSCIGRVLPVATMPLRWSGRFFRSCPACAQSRHGVLRQRTREETPPQWRAAGIQLLYPDPLMPPSLQIPPATKSSSHIATRHALKGSLSVLYIYH